MKTVGIMADNYKLDKFKEKLSEAGFRYTIENLKLREQDISKINILCHQAQLDKIRIICFEVEQYFKNQ